MTCTQQFWEFFRPLAESVEGVNIVTRSGGDKMDRLIERTRSEDIYPAIFLLRPKYTVEENGASNTVAWFDATFFVLCYCPTVEDADEDATFDLAEQMATSLTTTIRNQEDDWNVLADPTAKTYMEPITLTTGERSFGYEVRFRIGLMVNSAIYEAL